MVIWAVPLLERPDGDLEVDVRPDVRPKAMQERLIPYYGINTTVSPWLTNFSHGPGAAKF